jgi:hypothetical protein
VLACDTISPGERSSRMPGIDPSLSMVPPVWPRPRPASFTHASPRAATRGAKTIDTPSDTPPVECLSTTGRSIPSSRNVVPDATNASVIAVVSARSNPRIALAIRNAAIGPSPIRPWR